MVKTMQKQNVSKELSWFKAENYNALSTLSLTEVCLELHIRNNFSTNKFIHLAELNMLKQMGKSDNELPKLKDANTDFNFWMKKIVDGNPILSKQLIHFTQLKYLKTIEETYSVDYYDPSPPIQLVTFDSLEKLYLKAKEKLDVSTDRNFLRQVSSVYDLFESHEIYHFRDTLFQVSLGHTSDESLKIAFESQLPYARSKLGIKGQYPPQVEKKKNKFSQYSINLSFFKTLYVQRLIQLSDCINWFALYDLPVKKALIIDTIYKDVGQSQANIYQTHFKNVSLITDISVISKLRNILVKNPENKSKSLSALLEELRIADIQKNK
jgi:hypothetical protein